MRNLLLTTVLALFICMPAAAEEDLFAKAGIERPLAGEAHELTSGFSGPRVILRLVREGDEAHIRLWVGPDVTASGIAIETEEGVDVYECEVHEDPGDTDRMNLTSDIESRCSIPIALINRLKLSRSADVQVRFADGSQMRQAKTIRGQRLRDVTTLREIDPEAGLRPIQLLRKGGRW